MSAQAAAFASILVVINGDTGGGGLKQTGGGTAFVYDVTRQGDQLRTTNWPNIEVQFTEDDDCAMNTASGPDTVNLGIRFLIKTDRDAANSFAVQDPVADRLHVLLRRVALATASDGTRSWAFSPCERVGKLQQVPGGKSNDFVVAYACVAKGT